jgi:hypothetical protein
VDSVIVTALAVELPTGPRNDCHHFGTCELNVALAGVHRLNESFGIRIVREID